jgi:hypothetical protein
MKANTIRNSVQKSLTNTGNSPSWEANSHLPSQKIPHLLWNPKVHYCVQNSPPLVHILSQINPVHILTTYFFKIRSNIILPSTPKSSRVVSCLQVFRSTFCTHLISHAYYMPRPTHPPRFDHPNSIWWCIDVKKSSLCGLLQPPALLPLS